MYSPSRAGVFFLPTSKCNVLTGFIISRTTKKIKKKNHTTLPDYMLPRGGAESFLQHSLCHSKMCKQNPRKLPIQPLSHLRQDLSPLEKSVFVIEETETCQPFPANAASRMLTQGTSCLLLQIVSGL